jgi:hypothetical protein
MLPVLIELRIVVHDPTETANHDRIPLMVQLHPEIHQFLYQKNSQYVPSYYHPSRWDHPEPRGGGTCLHW